MASLDALGVAALAPYSPLRSVLLFGVPALLGHSLPMYRFPSMNPHLLSPYYDLIGVEKWRETPSTYPSNS